MTTWQDEQGRVTGQNESGLKQARIGPRILLFSIFVYNLIINYNHENNINNITNT